MRARGIEPFLLTASISGTDGIGEMGTVPVGTIEAVTVGWSLTHPFEKRVFGSMRSNHVFRKGGTSWSF